MRTPDVNLLNLDGIIGLYLIELFRTLNIADL